MVFGGGRACEVGSCWLSTGSKPPSISSACLRDEQTTQGQMKWNWYHGGRESDEVALKLLSHEGVSNGRLQLHWFHTCSQLVDRDLKRGLQIFFTGIDSWGDLGIC